MGRCGLPLSKPTRTKRDKGRLHSVATLSQSHILILESRTLYSKLLGQSGLKEAKQSRTDLPKPLQKESFAHRIDHTQQETEAKACTHTQGVYTSRLSLLAPRLSLYLFIILMSLNKSRWGIFSLLRPPFQQLSAAHFSVPQHTPNPSHPCGLYTKSLHRQCRLTVFTAALELDGLEGTAARLHFTDGRGKNTKLKI